MTKSFFFSLLLILSAIMFLPFTTKAQVTIGSTYDPQPFSVLELFSSGERGFRLPQLTERQRNDMGVQYLTGNDSIAAMGLQIFNTTNFCVETWNGERWISFCRSDGDGGGETITSCDWTFPENVTLAGATWTTRNLAETGRGFVASPHNFGGLFQWGRDADGHQNPASDIRNVRATSPTPGHSDFIIATSFPANWLSPSNDALWNSGLNNPCPAGWQVPSETQLRNLLELPSVWVSNFCDGVNGRIFGTDNPAYFDPALHLFLPAAGNRCSSTGAFEDAGNWGSYWSSSTRAWFLSVNRGFVDVGIGSRQGGFSVRCVRD